MKRLVLATLVTSISAIALAYGCAALFGGPSRLSAWVMAIATPVAMIATTAFGAARTGQAYGGLGGLLLPFGAVLLIMLGAFAAALLLPGAGEPLLLGLPRRAAIVLYGIGILPALILPITYALTFDELTLTDEDIERVREAASRAGHGADE